MSIPQLTLQSVYLEPYLLATILVERLQFTQKCTYKNLVIEHAQVLALARQLKEATAWSDAIMAADNPIIYPIVDPNNGGFIGEIR